MPPAATTVPPKGPGLPIPAEHVRCCIRNTSHPQGKLEGDGPPPRRGRRSLAAGLDPAGDRRPPRGQQRGGVELAEGLPCAAAARAPAGDRLGDRLGGGAGESVRASGIDVDPERAPRFPGPAEIRGPGPSPQWLRRRSSTPPAVLSVGSARKAMTRRPTKKVGSPGPRSGPCRPRILYHELPDS
jgi:hypothetical protein